MRLYGNAEVFVEDIGVFLTYLDNAYSGVQLSCNIIDDLRTTHRPFPPDFYFIAYRFGSSGFPLAFPYPVTTRRRPPYARPVGTEVLWLADALRTQERLSLKATRFESPGWWEFLGKLNPLEVLRQYLNDRHKQKEDRDINWPAAKRRLELENALMENKVIRERIDIVKSLGATEQDLAPLKNQLLFLPLRALDRPQDEDIISTAEVKSISDESRG
jgi:hypothetical protein